MSLEYVLQSKGPPTDVEPTELMRKLLDSVRPSEVIDFPRRDQDGNPIAKVRAIVLSQIDIDNCCANAESYAKRLLKGDVRREAWEEVYNNAKCIEVLYECLRDIDDINKRVFTAPSRIRELLTIDECIALFQSYEAVQFRFGPMWRMLSDDELEQWIERLTTGVAAYPLSHLGHGALVQLTVSLAFRLRELRTGTGSAGSPSLDGSSEITLTSTK